MCLTEYDKEACIRTWREDEIDIGRAQGLAEGEQHGACQKAIETARNALNMNLSVEQAAQISGLTQEDVAALKKVNE